MANILNYNSNYIIIIVIILIYFIGGKFLMIGYPVSYGDFDTHKIDLSNSSKPTLKILSFVLMLGNTIVTPAFAAEPVTAVATTTKEVSQASLALTCAVCAAAGAVCKSAADSAVRKNPKLIVPFGCVALMSWCAAKASPL
jgi:Trk-type K+ transport system membrane component